MKTEAMPKGVYIRYMTEEEPQFEWQDANHRKPAKE